jgi:hypothetical protein
MKGLTLMAFGINISFGGGVGYNNLRYCQMLGMALGGDPFFNNAVDEFYSSDYFSKPFRMMQFDPPFLSTSAKLKSHG